jgi:hypothetical protein
MQQARGGILFIDEAHGLYSPTGNCYAQEAVEALVGHITEKEFKGNLLVIMAGYTEELDHMFSRANPGLRSRFDKIRVVFPAWTGKQAALAVIAAVEAEGKTITIEAKLELQKSFDCLSLRPSWASARDVFENIIPAMFTNRAVRLANTMLSGAPINAESANADKFDAYFSSSKEGPNCSTLLPPANYTQQLPYDVSDVKGAFKSLLGPSNGGTVVALSSATELQAAINSASRCSVQRLVVVNVCCNANDCELSANIAHAFEDLNCEFSGSNVLFAKMNLTSDEESISLDEKSIQAGALFLCFYGGAEVQRLIGTSILLLRQFILSFLAQASSHPLFNLAICMPVILGNCAIQLSCWIISQTLPHSFIFKTYGAFNKYHHPDALHTLLINLRKFQYGSHLHKMLDLLFHYTLAAFSKFRQILDEFQFTLFRHFFMDSFLFACNIERKSYSIIFY